MFDSAVEWILRRELARNMANLSVDKLKRPADDRTRWELEVKELEQLCLTVASGMNTL